MDILFFDSEYAETITAGYFPELPNLTEDEVMMAVDYMCEENKTNIEVGLSELIDSCWGVNAGYYITAQGMINGESYGAGHFDSVEDLVEFIFEMYDEIKIGSYMQSYMKIGIRTVDNNNSLSPEWFPFVEYFIDDKVSISLNIAIGFFGDEQQKPKPLHKGQKLSSLYDCVAYDDEEFLRKFLDPYIWDSTLFRQQVCDILIEESLCV